MVGIPAPLRFIILQVRVAEVTGYDEDVVFLVVPDESEFSRHVPLVLGTCMLCRIINMIRESEINRFSVPWAMTQMLCLLSWCETTDLSEGAVGGTEEAQTLSTESTDKGIDEPVMVREHVKVGLFQTQILECKVKPLLRETALVMVCPIRVGKTQLARMCPLHPGLHVLHMLMRLKMESGKVSVVVHNMLDSPIYLKKGTRIARVESTLPVPSAGLSPEVQTALGKEIQPEPLSVAAQREKLCEKLNLDGLSSWTPGNTAAARELVLAFHEVFALDDNELGCTSAIEHEICITDSESFKERFRQIPSPLLEEVSTCLRDMLEVGNIHPSQSPWCNTVVLVCKKDGSLHFCVDFRRLNAHMKKDSYLLLRIQEVLKSMAGTSHFSTMDFKSRFWQVCIAPGLQQYTTFTVGNLGFYEFTHMPFGLCNAPATFQHLMQNILGELNLTYCVIYLDDVIIFGQMEEEHLKRLCVVLERFCEFNLKLKPLKCLFF